MTLPALNYDSWAPAKNTCHLWCQIVGKTKLGLTSRRNHWWNVPLYVSARGLTTGRMPGNLEVELNLVDHRLTARTPTASDGFDLSDCLTVATFHERFVTVLDRMGVTADIRPEPFGVPMTTPFPEDVEHTSYDADAAGRFPNRAPVECGRLRRVRRLVLRQDEPGARLLAQLRPGRHPLLRPAGAGDARRRLGHGRSLSCPTTTSAPPMTPAPPCSTSSSPPTRPAPRWAAGTSKAPVPTGAPSHAEVSVADTCSHLDAAGEVTPSSEGCEDCIPIGSRWVHLRVCMTCGHVGCCDSSPNRHATAHFHTSSHPLIQSYEPGDDWWWCYVDEVAFAVDGGPKFSHP